MKVMVTGAKGMLGRDLCPMLEDLGCNVLETDIDNLDITDKEAVLKFVEKKRPDLIIHLAAYTNVDKAEEEPEKAELINGAGTENVAIAASKIDVPIIGISTVYFFDGTRKTPYKITDPVNPINVYGKTKLMGEEAILKHCKKYYIARTSWLYGRYGKNFVDTMLSLKDSEELKVVNDQTGMPTWTRDLAYAIIKLSAEPYGIYHLSGGGKAITWYKFAKAIFEYEKVNVNLKPCTTKEFPRPAKRPKYSAMENGGFLRDWREALQEYLERKKYSRMYE